MQMIFIGIGVMIPVFYLLLILPTKWLKIEYMDYPLSLNKKIVQISDLHVEMLRISPGKLEQVIHAEKPDLIVLTGDFTRKERYIPRLGPYLRMLNQTGIPLFAVLGNHDYRIRDVTKLLEALRREGVEVLRNESRTFPDFELVGIDDYHSRHSDVDESFAQVSGGKPVVVITHDPNVIPEIGRPFDYLMAGHLHGKQFNLPFFFQVKNKGRLPSQGIYKGLHYHKGGAFYISKGIGQAGINARLFVRSEITIHYL